MDNDVSYHQGNRVKVIPPSNIYKCVLHDDVFVGPFCEIQEGVIIGERTRVQSHSFICTGVTIGPDCFIGHCVMFCNDRLVDDDRQPCVHRDKKDFLTTHVAERVLIGNNATILPGLSLCTGTIIGAGSVVTKSTTVPGTYAGNPAQLLRAQTP